MKLKRGATVKLNTTLTNHKIESWNEYYNEYSTIDADNPIMVGRVPADFIGYVQERSSEYSDEWVVIIGQYRFLFEEQELTVV